MTEVPARRSPGAPCWVSLLTRSLPVAQEFYSGLFGWEFQRGPMHFGPYVRAVLDGELVAGIGENPRGRALPVSWTTYLSTLDADHTAELVRDCGGTVAVGPLDADDEAGRMAIAMDPEGAVFGVWQPLTHLGVGVCGRPGTLGWNELVTRQTTGLGKFYAAVFGFEPQRADGVDADHLTLRLQGVPVAGMRGLGRALPRDLGAHWMTYFEVDDTDAAARRAARLGGRVLSGPEESVRGRTAVVRDPEGAVFALLRTRR
ncbi:VOC family protein [Streptomyces sp. ICBB 8177]|uniref:VOC family protein n=1 Tax=Streptomyces sp. ICBB 8177 TaxID=563922 RepID=UPI000D675123|nr:VOC family protein [Streptomyces sp. ICBB 8177]PWI45221.1 glyoxalase/bleomycin resistance/extradiol dioxygenase family protein [Streptomyces sp. ICBB 8177]